MTLHELMNLVPEAKWVVRVPSIKMLLNEAKIVLRDHSNPDVLALVFDNGFVAYQRMGMVTVFRCTNAGITATRTHLGV